MANNYAAREDGCFRVICTVPDINITPVGCAKIPIPYFITTTLGKANKASQNVMIERHAAFIFSSDTISTTGAAPGVDKGIKSGTVNAKAQPKDKSSTFYINGQNVIRVHDLFYMNNKNTLGILVNSIPVPVGHITDEGTLPPPPPEELGFFESAWEWTKDTANAALVTAVEIDEKYKIVARAEGAGMVVVGTLEMAAGVVLVAAPEPTMVTKVAGAGTIVLGADTGSSGISQVWTGERTSTALERTVEVGSQMIGVSPETAAYASMGVGAISKPTKIVGEVAHYGMDAAKSEVKAQAERKIQEQLGIEIPDANAGGNGKNKSKGKGQKNDNKKIGKDGAESKGSQKCQDKGEDKRKGDCAEKIINEQMKKQNFAPFDTSKLTNNQGNGFDNIGINPNGDVRMVIIETKANRSKLSKQQKLGGDVRTTKIIKEMNKALEDDGFGRYKHMMEYLDKEGMIPKSQYSSPSEFKEKLKELKKELEESNGMRFYCVCRVRLQKDKTGCYGKIDSKSQKTQGLCKASSIKCTPWVNKKTPSNNEKEKSVCKKIER